MHVSQLVINILIVKIRGKGKQWCDYRMGRVEVPVDQLHVTIVSIVSPSTDLFFNS